MNGLQIFFLFHLKSICSLSSTLLFLTALFINIIIFRLVSLGYHYHVLERFVADVKNPLDGGEDHRKGLYLRAFCHGLDGVLDDYRKVVLEAEQAMLKETHPTLTFLLQHFGQQFLLLPQLRELVAGITERSLRGTRIFDEVITLANTGIPILRSALVRIAQSCQEVFINQVTSWLVFGSLADPFFEFFIKDVTPGPASPAPLLRKTPGLTRVPRREYELDVELLPSFLSSRLGGKILAIGRAVIDTRFSTEGSLSGSAQQQLSDRLWAFHKSSKVLNVTVFEALVDEIRLPIAALLTRLVLVDSHLLQHLEGLRAYFLVGNGDFYTNFFQQTGSLQWGVSAQLNSIDVNQVFRRAAAQSHTQLDPIFDHFRAGLTPFQQLSQEDMRFLGSIVDLEYRIDWPLDAFFTPDNMRRYKRLFHCLLSVRKVQTSLQSAWMAQTAASKGRRRAQSRPDAALTYSRRSLMAYFIDHLQFYLQSDVIDRHFSQLKRKMQETQDFDSLVGFHEEFLGKIYSQCFLEDGRTSSALAELLEFCHKFTTNLANLHYTPQPNTKALEECFDQFEKRLSFLFRYLTRVQGSQLHPHMGQLLFRLDFNKFFAFRYGDKAESKEK